MPYQISPRVQSGMLCLVTFLSACGGGSETPTPALSVSIAAPAAANQVFSLNAPIAVSARVTVNGASAPDGDREFLRPSGTGFATASTLTHGGTASTTLTASTPGKQTFTATATLSGATGTSSQTVYVRQPPTPLEILVPAYFYPSAGAPTGTE